MSDAPTTPSPAPDPNDPLALAELFAGGGEPWLPLHPDWRTRNVAAQAADPASMLSLHRALLALRRASEALAIGSLTLIDAADDVLAYERQRGDQAADGQPSGAHAPCPSGEHDHGPEQVEVPLDGQRPRLPERVQCRQPEAAALAGGPEGGELGQREQAAARHLARVERR